NVCAGKHMASRRRHRWNLFLFRLYRMKPCSRKVLTSANLLQTITTGPIIAKIAGSVKKLGQQYQNANIVLYNKANLQPIAMRKPDQNGNYSFLGLNTDL